MSKHTPGPWSCETNADGSFLVDAEKGGHSGGYYVVCDRGPHGMTGTTHADARLIASAPDLLATLRDCRDYLSCIPESAAGGDDMAVALTRACDEAIKQATGEQQ